MTIVCVEGVEGFWRMRGRDSKITRYFPNIQRANSYIAQGDLLAEQDIPAKEAARDWPNLFNGAHINVMREGGGQVRGEIGTHRDFIPNNAAPDEGGPIDIAKILGDAPFKIPDNPFNVKPRMMVEDILAGEVQRLQRLHYVDGARIMRNAGLLKTDGPACKNCYEPIAKNDNRKFVFDLTGQCVKCATGSLRKWDARIFRDADVRRRGTGNSIGIEIECNPSIALIRKMRDAGWGVKADNSLRGLSAEFVSPILYEDSFKEEVESILSGQTASLYNRCGLHIWIGSSHLSWCDLDKVIKYCACWQEQFETFVSPSRRLLDVNDPSGRPVRLNRDVFMRVKSKQDLVKLLYGSEKLWQQDEMDKNMKGKSRMRLSKRCNDKQDETKPWVDTTYHGGILSRYQWANFHGHFHRGAIEIRLHQGTVDPEKIINWIDLWLAMVREVPRIEYSRLLTKHPFEVMPPHLASYFLCRQNLYMNMRHDGKLTPDLTEKQLVGE